MDASAHETYCLKNSRYVLLREGVPASPPLDEVSVGLDLRTGQLLGHGLTPVVEMLMGRERRRRQRHDPERVLDLVLFTGRLPLADLNRCLAKPGYVLAVWLRVWGRQQEQQEWSLT